jgi:anthranilate synthase/phosphoribosyltransferase
MILLIDNYDSFTYILKQYFELCGQTVIVKRNDEVTIAEAKAMSPEYLVISPGPATPREAGVSMEMIRAFSGVIPILGVCLGHQSIGDVFGGKIIRNYRIMHGKQSPIQHDGKGVFRGLPTPFLATRYHSLVIDPESFPDDELIITARTAEGEIMGVRHKRFPIEGVQFHPESFKTEHGLLMIKNFLGQSTEIVSSYDIKDLIKKVARHEDLTEDESVYVANGIMEGIFSSIQVATLLAELAEKGEVLAEITGFAKVMRSKATHIKRPANIRVVDTCGTGGDGRHTINVSTLAALVAAAAGVTIAKHGNRSVSSSCGSADVLERLGLNLAVSPERNAEILDKVGIAFLFAPSLHSAMKNVAPIRREMGIRTIFNLLGPLTNPASADAQVVGVFSNKYVPLVAAVLHQLGTEEAFVVHSEDGLDEISISAPTVFAHLKDGKISEGIIDPKDLLGRTYDLAEISGGSPEVNEGLSRDILQGKKPGAMTEVVCVNAGAAIMVAGLASSLKAGFALAKKTLESGAAWDKLVALAAATK